MTAAARPGSGPRPDLPGVSDAPDTVALVEAIADLVRDQVMPAVEGELRYLLRVSLTALGIIARELENGPEFARAQQARLAALGCADNAELAARLRDGTIDAFDPEVLRLVTESVRDKVRLADPRFLNA
jgi:hypothetical protein